MKSHQPSSCHLVLGPSPLCKAEMGLFLKKSMKLETIILLCSVCELNNMVRSLGDMYCIKVCTAVCEVFKINQKSFLSQPWLQRLAENETTLGN